MPPFEDLAVTLTVSVDCEEDFLFPKKKEELAQRIRSDCVPRIDEIQTPRHCNVAIDEEGDVRIGSEGFSVFVTKEGIIHTDWTASMGSVADRVPQAAGTIGSLVKARDWVRVQGYDVRLFVRLRYRKALPIGVLQSGLLASAVAAVADRAGTPKVQALSWSIEYASMEFTNNLAIEAHGRDITLRTGRRAPVTAFKSTGDFLLAANVHLMTEDVRPLLEPLIAEPEDLWVTSFRPMQSA